VGVIKDICPYTPTQDLLVHIRSQVNLSRPTNGPRKMRCILWVSLGAGGLLRRLAMTKVSVRSAWVAKYEYVSTSECTSGCASFCGYVIRNDSYFRGGVFGSAGNAEIYIIKNRPNGRCLYFCIGYLPSIRF
jgi:hypothetical protein